MELVVAPARQLTKEWVYRTPKGVSGEGDYGSRTWVPALLVLVRHEFRARYRAQALGAAWSVLNPIIMMGVLSVVLTHAWGGSTQNYRIFLLTGLIFWNFVSTSINASVNSLVQMSDIIKRTMLPRQLIPLSVMLSYVINLGIESIAVLAFVPIYRSAFHPSIALIALPAVLVLLVILLSGVVLMGSVLNVIYRDVGYLVSTALLLFYWLTPIIYPLDTVVEPYRSLLRFNPLSPILGGIRGIVMEGTFPSGFNWAMMSIVSTVIFTTGWVVFRRFEHMALDYV